MHETCALACPHAPDLGNGNAGGAGGFLKIR
jgi:hypothetical protein